MSEKNNARPSLQARRAVAEQRNDFIKSAVLAIAFAAVMYLLLTQGMYWLLVALGRLP